MPLEAITLGSPQQLQDLYNASGGRPVIRIYMPHFDRVHHKEVYVYGPKHPVGPNIRDIVLAQYDQSQGSQEDRRRAEMGVVDPVNMVLYGRVKGLPLQWMVYHLSQNDDGSIAGFVVENSVDYDPQKPIPQKLKREAMKRDKGVIVDLLNKANGMHVDRQDILQRQIKASEATYLSKVLNFIAGDELGWG